MSVNNSTKKEKVKDKAIDGINTDSLDPYSGRPSLIVGMKGWLTRQCR